MKVTSRRKQLDRRLGFPISESPRQKTSQLFRDLLLVELDFTLSYFAQFQNVIVEQNLRAPRVFDLLSIENADRVKVVRNQVLKKVLACGKVGNFRLFVQKPTFELVSES